MSSYGPEILYTEGLAFTIGIIFNDQPVPAINILLVFVHIFCYVLNQMNGTLFICVKQVTIAGDKISLETELVKAAFDHMQRVMCPLPLVSISEEQEVLTIGYIVAVSNDRQNHSDTRNLTTYNSVCMNCSSDMNCFQKVNSIKYIKRDSPREVMYYMSPPHGTKNNKIGRNVLSLLWISLINFSNKEGGETYIGHQFSVGVNSC